MPVGAPLVADLHAVVVVKAVMKETSKSLRMDIRLHFVRQGTRGESYDHPMRLGRWKPLRLDSFVYENLEPLVIYFGETSNTDRAIISKGFGPERLHKIGLTHYE